MMYGYFAKDLDEEVIQSLKKKTGFDENTIGCFLANYGIPYVCSAVHPVCYCKKSTKCETLRGMMNE